MCLTPFIKNLSTVRKLKSYEFHNFCQVASSFTEITLFAKFTAFQRTLHGSLYGFSFAFASKSPAILTNLPFSSLSKRSLLPQFSFTFASKLFAIMLKLLFSPLKFCFLVVILLHFIVLGNDTFYRDIRVNVSGEYRRSCERVVHLKYNLEVPITPTQ